MQTNNQNNWEAIRLQLEESDRFPGEVPFNKAVAWDKLHSRLTKRSSFRKPILYWSAAAMLLIMVGLGWLRNSSTADRRQRTITGRSFPANTMPSSDRLPATNNTTAIADKPTKPFATNTGILHNRQGRKPGTRLLTKSSSVVSPISMASPSIHLPAVLPDTTAPVLVMQSAPVRKLKTIHNNRLNSILYKPELSVGDAGHFAPSSSGYFLFGRNQSDNILQIKLPSNN